MKIAEKEMKIALTVLGVLIVLAFLAEGACFLAKEDKPAAVAAGTVASNSVTPAPATKTPDPEPKPATIVALEETYKLIPKGISVNTEVGVAGNKAAEILHAGDEAKEFAQREIVRRQMQEQELKLKKEELQKAIKDLAVLHVEIVAKKTEIKQTEKSVFVERNTLKTIRDPVMFKIQQGRVGDYEEGLARIQGELADMQVNQLTAQETKIRKLREVINARQTVTIIYSPPRR